MRGRKRVDPNGRGGWEELEGVDRKKVYSYYISWTNNLCLINGRKKWEGLCITLSNL